MAHILLLPSWYPSCPSDVAGVFFRDQAIALTKIGHKVGVIAISSRSVRTLGSPPEGSGLSPLECDEGMPTYRRCIWTAFPQIPHVKYWLWCRAADSMLREYIKSYGRPDIVHAHSAIYAGAVAARWRRRYGIPLVVTEHSSGFARSIYRKWEWNLAGMAAKHADARLAVSPALCDLLRERLPTGNLEWKWMPNGVSPRFDQIGNRTPSRDRPIRILNLALMTENKGQKDLIEAFSKAFENVPHVELWLGGDGPLKKDLEKLANEIGLGARVQFLGRIAPCDVPNLFAEIDILAVSSHYETFGVVAAEALVAGVPVVATRCGGPECIIGPGDGLLIPPRSPHALAGALAAQVRALGNLDRSEIAARARQQFSSEAIAARLDGVYRRVTKYSPL